MNSLHVLRFQNPSLQILTNDLNLKNEKYENKNLDFIDKKELCLEVKNLFFSYKKENYNLENLSILFKSDNIYGDLW